MSTCMANAHRYVGKGLERELFEGPCVLEIGHDGDHLPSGLAYKQQYERAFNDGVTTALESVKINLHDRLKMTEAFDEELLGHVLDEIATEVRRT
jgi:hypothetical protein